MKNNSRLLIIFSPPFTFYLSFPFSPFLPRFLFFCRPPPLRFLLLFLFVILRSVSICPSVRPFPRLFPPSRVVSLQQCSTTAHRSASCLRHPATLPFAQLHSGPDLPDCAAGQPRCPKEYRVLWLLCGSHAGTRLLPRC